MTSFPLGPVPFDDEPRFQPDGPPSWSQRLGAFRPMTCSCNGGVRSALFDDAPVDTTPLWKTISRSIDDAMMADLAAEYQKGHVILIGTTDLDLVLPDLGAVAVLGFDPAMGLEAFRLTFR